MDLLNILLIGVALSFDGAAVAAANGARHHDMRFFKALEIAVVFGLFHFIMPLFGHVVGLGFESFIRGVDHWVAFILLAGLGIKMLLESFKSVEEKEIDIHDYKILLLLAVATSVDALVIGISFAFLPVNVWWAATVIGTVIFFVTLVSIYLGKKFGEIWGKKAEVIGALVLIGIGLKILFSHIW